MLRRLTLTLPQYSPQDVTTVLFQERAAHTQRMDKLEKTLEELRREAGHMRSLIEANKKTMLEEVEIKISTDNQQLTATLEKTMTTVLSEILRQHALSMAQQEITNAQMDKRQSQETLHRQEEHKENKALLAQMILLFHQNNPVTFSAPPTHLPEQIAPATPQTKISRVRSPKELPPRPAPFNRREEQDMENEGWEDDDRDLDQTLQNQEENHTPPSPSEEEGTAYQDKYMG